MNSTAKVITNSDEIVSLFPQAAHLSYPPNCFVDMQGEFIEYVEGVSLKVRFPVQSKYENPLGFMQGGMLLSAVDNTIGPLSYMVAPPSVTTTLNANYFRPVPPTMKYIDVIGRVLERTRSLVHLEAEVFDENSRLLVKVTSTSMILPKKTP